MPDGWEWCRLGILCQKIGAGKTPLGGKSQYVSSGIPLIREQNVHNDGLSYDGMAFITQETNQSMKGSQVFAKDLLMNITGGSIGRTALIIDDFSGGNVNQHVLIIRLINSPFRHFIHRVLHSDFILGLMFSKQTGDKPGLSAEKVNRFLIPIPPLAEQQRIVEQIETLLGYVDIIDTDAEILDKSITLAKQKILDLAIRGKLVPQDPTDEPASELLKKIKAEKEAFVKAGKLKKDKHESFIFKGDDNCYYEQLTDKTVDITEETPFDLPESWCWCRFSTLVNFVMGKTPARSQKEFWTMPFLPWVSIADMIPGGVITETKEFISSNALSHCFSGRISPAGTLIMSFKLTIGRVSILNMPAQHNEAIISIFPFVDQENIHRDYLLKILPLMVDFVKKSPAIKGNTLNSDSLSKMLIPLPPLAEQKRIVACITQYETILKSIQE